MDTSIATLLDYRPLTLRNEKERAIFRIQNGITEAVRRFLKGKGFTEIHTPKIGSAGAEGGLGLGLERFTSRLLGFENVRRASLFPRDIHRLVP